MITYRELKNTDIIFLKKLISDEGKNYEQFLKIGWSSDEILNQFAKITNLSIGVFYNNSLVSFIIGDLFNIEKILEYEILLIYVCKRFRNQGIGTTLIKKIEENNNCLKKIYLEVSNDNSDAISFYLKMKFNKIYKRKNYFLLEDKTFDAIVMLKTY